MKPCALAESAARSPAASSRPDGSAASEVDELVQRLRGGDIRACARLISRIERGESEVVPVLQALYRIGGRSRVVGVTGPPGAGKSTLINRLVGEWRRLNRSVAVIAVDPSSPFSGGAVLGDRLRMSEHSCDEGVFIRSMASRGRLGGLARAAGDALTVLDAMPWDVVLIETVGVGQNETDIMRFASAVVLLQTPMGGDDVQAAKAGITEIADVFVVNKSDHPEADRTVRQLEDMITLALCLNPERVWHPPVVKTQAVLGEGVAMLVDQIDRRFAYLGERPETARKRRREQVAHRVGEIVREMLDQRIQSRNSSPLDSLVDRVVDRESDPYALADTLFGRAG